MEEIQLKKINADRREKRKCERIYLRSFPANERAPFRMLSKKSKMDGVDFWGIYSSEKLIGFFYIVCDNDLAYIFYFAIDENERRKGFGSAVLQKLKREYKSMRLFLASEEIDETAPNLEERIKRKNFYLNNGFEDLHTKIQEGTVMFDALGIGGEIKDYEYRIILKVYLHISARIISVPAELLKSLVYLRLGKML